MPHGIGGVLTAFLPVVFGMFGAEVATIAAGESENPQQAVWVAVKSVVWRVMLFYIGSISIVLIVLPWTSITPGLSPFVTMLNVAGVGWAGLAMSVIVLSATLSTLNASLYTASRMAFSLAGRDEAPRALRRVTKRGTPAAAILCSAVVGFLCVVLNYTAPEYVFTFLVNSISAIAIFVWIIIAISQLRSRKILGAPRPGAIAMWGHPWLGIGLIAVLVFLIAYVFTTGPTAVVEMLSSCTVAAICVAAGLLMQRRRSREPDLRVPAETSPSGEPSSAGDLL
jgi:GABA permease/aromatic amino acid permease